MDYPEYVHQDLDCCGNERWRGRLCQYHQGVEEGWESAMQYIKDQSNDDNQ